MIFYVFGGSDLRLMRFNPRGLLDRNRNLHPHFCKAPMRGAETQRDRRSGQRSGVICPANQTYANVTERSINAV